MKEGEGMPGPTRKRDPRGETQKKEGRESSKKKKGGEERERERATTRLKKKTKKEGRASQP